METVRLERNTESRKASKSGNKNERKKNEREIIMNDIA